MTATIPELRTAMEQKAQIMRDGVTNGVTIEGNNVTITKADMEYLRKVASELKEIKELLDYAEAKDQIGTGRREGGYQSTAVAAAAAGAMIPQQTKTLGQMFTESEEFKDLVRGGGFTMRVPYELKGHPDIVRMGTIDFERKDVHTGSMPALSNLGFGRVQFDPLIPRQQRPYRVRDLFSAVATAANLIDYFRVVGFAENNGDGNAQTVAERRASDETSEPTGASTDVFGKKPKSNLVFSSQQAPVRTIAHWEAAHRNVLADEPQLQGTINNELLYGLALEEDEQVLNGDGTGENLVGILRTPGIQAYTQVNGDKKSDALRRAATLSFIANFPGTGFVLHPFDWEDVELQKATGDGHYMLVTNIAVGADTRIWRQPVVETVAMTQGTFLTGAFGLGAQLYDRQVASIRIAEQHQDFFIRNAIAILAEQRLALAVKRPESFVKGTFIS
jgi:HK97 family phage major capsid protein